MRESDVLQTAYVEVVRSMPKFRGQSEGEFVTWIMSIIENGIRRENRWFAARKRRMPESTTERNVLARLLLDPPATPSQEMMQLEERALFAAALQRLPQHYAEIIDLVLLQGMSHEDAALRMNKTASATRMLLSRARAALMTEVDRIERDSTS